MIFLFELSRTDRYENQSVEWLIFLFVKKSFYRDVSPIANKDINNFLNMKEYQYIGFNFDFKPYTS